MIVFARKRDLVLACVALGLAAVALASAGSARTAAQECFFKRTTRATVVVTFALN